MKERLSLTFCYEVREGLSTVSTFVGGSDVYSMALFQGVKGRILEESDTFSSQDVANFLLSFSFSLSSTRSKERAMRAYDSTGSSRALALSARMNAMQAICYSLLLWSTTLLLLWFVEPVTQMAEKFLLYRIFAW